MLNESDLARLEALKVARFRQAMGGMMLQAALCITLDNALVIPCLSEAEVLALQQEADALL